MKPSSLDSSNTQYMLTSWKQFISLVLEAGSVSLSLEYKEMFVRMPIIGTLQMSYLLSRNICN
jgi:hypothetical protein